MKKILFINQGITPFIAESPISTLGKALPEAMQAKGHEIRTFMPKWGTINERRNQLHEVIRLSGINLIIDDTDHPLIIKVASIPGTRIQVYFIDNSDYFARKNGDMGIDEKGKECPDNGERAVFFARGVLETVMKLRWTPDIIHCQGWMSAVVPFYLKTIYKDEPCYRDVKVVTSIFAHELELEFGDRFKNIVEYEEAKKEYLDKYADKFNCIELAKLAIDYSDGIIEPIENINKELLQYAEEQKKRLMKFADIQNIGDSYETFYESL